MSVVAVVETLAWVISIALAGWMLLDMTRVARRHDEASLINAADPLEEPEPRLESEPAPEPGRTS